MDPTSIVFAIFAGTLIAGFAHLVGLDWRRTTLLLMLAFALTAIAVALGRATSGGDPFHGGTVWVSWVTRAIIAASAGFVMWWMDR